MADARNLPSKHAPDAGNVRILPGEEGLKIYFTTTDTGSIADIRSRPLRKLKNLCMTVEIIKKCPDNEEYVSQHAPSIAFLVKSLFSVEQGANMDE